MQLYHKKKVEMVVDAACVPQLLAMCERVGAKGHTLISNVSGKGHRGARSEGDLFDVFRNVLIIIIASDHVAGKIVEGSQKILENYAGIVYVSDVEVVRNDHF
jgi:nitrogen regulatory protein PII